MIEDAAQSHGALYKGLPVGTLGTIGAFSTMSGNHHATGEQGGVVFTSDEALYQRTRRVADRGKPFGLPAGSTNITASLNFNLDDLSAAIDLAQIRKLSNILRRRRAIARAIGEGCRGFMALAPCWTIRR